ncbi:MAG: Rieske (2Fe-2S) protein [Desulfuromonadales bacterium]|nr:Rieske (2Fe-2S) protein [Desulfuromonadales bacterium]
MIFAAKLNEVPNFGKKVVSLNNLELLLINIKGKIFACENYCPHQGSTIDRGIIKEEHISCPRHGYRFSLKDGKCIDYPQYTLKIFPVTIDGEDILIDL